LYGSQAIKGRWFEAATPACAWDCAFPPISCIPSFVRRNPSLGKLKKTREEATAFLLLPPPGKKVLELKKRRSSRCPRVAALVQLHPPKPPPRPAGGSHCLGYHLLPGGGLVGGRGHRKGQLRVLGRPSARRTKDQGTQDRGATGGAGSPRPLRTYLRVLKPDCMPPGPIGNVLAASGVAVWGMSLVSRGGSGGWRAPGAAGACKQQKCHSPLGL
jgi:hypothetical protein